jgi:hypothetical protein
MPANTANGYPYPLGTDRVMDGDDSIHALAQAVDDRLRVSAAGSAAIPAQPSAAAITFAITFPVGRFATAPQVVATPSNPYLVSAVVTPTAAGCTLYAMYRAGTGVVAAIGAGYTMSWLAIA